MALRDLDIRLEPYGAGDGADTWRDRALCREVDPEMFFPEQGEPATLARRICRRCPVRGACLDDAIEAGEKFGIWGGMSIKDRKVIARARARAAERLAS